MRWAGLSLSGRMMAMAVFRKSVAHANGVSVRCSRICVGANKLKTADGEIIPLPVRPIHVYSLRIVVIESSLIAFGGFATWQ
jgi:hypothetical protein